MSLTYNREAIYAALFAKLAAVPGLVTTSRRLKHWNDVPQSMQPALYQAQRNETAVQMSRQRVKWTFKLDVYLYVRTDGAQAPGPIINPLMDAIELALAPNAVEEVQTLGGLVAHCWIDGAIETDEGTLGDQAVAIIPITILVS